MVYSSVPAYLDPSNWHQQPNHHHLSGPTAATLPPAPHGSGGAGSIRPVSMTERARLANLPMPETALKCPRCESTNTKFCYFNNYNLSQPRHFCKTCRRYWTRGGALRSVPVGGGCRRNKRSSKGTTGKSPATTTDQFTGSGSSGATDALSLAGPQTQPLKYMAPMHSLAEFGNDHIGLNYGSGASLCGGSVLSMSGLEQWRMQQGKQFPLFGGLDISAAPSGLYPFEGGADQQASYGGGVIGQVRAKMSSSLSGQMEDNNQPRAALSRQFLGLPGNVNQCWSGTENADWADHFSDAANQL